MRKKIFFLFSLLLIAVFFISKKTFALKLPQGYKIILERCDDPSFIGNGCISGSDARCIANHCP